MKKPSRVLAIGDIHGGLRALIQVLERCSYDSEQDKLIFLGDYVDGYSQSAEVVQHLIGLEKGIRTNKILALEKEKESLTTQETRNQKLIDKIEDFLQVD